MSRRRKWFAYLVGFGLLMGLIGAVPLYYGVRKGQKQAAARMILDSQSISPTGPEVGAPAIPEGKRHEIYDRAILAAERIAVLDAEKRRDGVTPSSEYEPFLNGALSSAVRRIALGNEVTEGDVLQIVREGSANGW